MMFTTELVSYTTKKSLLLHPNLEHSKFYPYLLFTLNDVRRMVSVTMIKLIGSIGSRY